MVSERLSLDSEGVQDMSRGYKCGSYPFKNLLLVIAPQAELVRVKDGRDFIDVVGRRGMTFGLSPQALAEWTKQTGRPQP